MPDGWQPPFQVPNSLDQAAMADHELYSSWVRAGFYPEQAMMLLLHSKQMTHDMMMKGINPGE
jgi:hypothetical protein